MQSAKLISLQSGFRVGHSTETAVLRVLSDMLDSVDGAGEVASLVLLDLPAAFDTADVLSFVVGCRQPLE